MLLTKIWTWVEIKEPDAVECVRFNTPKAGLVNARQMPSVALPVSNRNRASCPPRRLDHVRNPKKRCRLLVAPQGAQWRNTLSLRDAHHQAVGAERNRGCPASCAVSTHRGSDLTRPTAQGRHCVPDQAHASAESRGRFASSTSAVAVVTLASVMSGVAPLAGAWIETQFAAFFVLSLWFCPMGESQAFRRAQSGD